MSFGGDGYGDERDYADSGRRGTRTRLPEGESGARAPVVRPGKSLVTVVGVVVLLIAAIAFANRGGGDSGSPDDSNNNQAQPTAPSGVDPVEGDGSIPSGFDRTEQGAESAAANYAVALGGDGMFTKDSRDEIVATIHTAESVPELQDDLDDAYSPSFLERVGLDDRGEAPDGLAFVSRTTPVGSKIIDYDDATATVEVWCVGLIGLSGEESTRPVQESWFTITQELAWTDSDWKISSSSQQEGPTPVPGDNRAATAEEMTEAAESYGGFTYAR